MVFLSNTRIKNKIIIIIFSVGALSTLTGSLLNYFYQLGKSKEQLITNTILQTKLMSEYCGLPMEFNYPDNAKEVLEKLKAIPDVYNGVLFTLNDSVFAAYSKFKGQAPVMPSELKNTTFFIEGNFIHACQPVIYKGKTYGTLYLRSFIDWKTIIYSQFIASLTILVCMLAIILIMANLLHKSISKPIVNLTDEMNIVAASKDYSAQFLVGGRDEIGELYAGFNTMMKELNYANSLQEHLYHSEKKLNSTLMFIAQKDWVKQEQMFTEALALFLARDLDVSHVVISRLTKKNKVLQTLALVSNAKLDKNISYPIHGNPCEHVIDNKLYCCRSGVEKAFPLHSIFVNEALESYLGILLWDAEGAPLGVIDIYDTKVMSEEKAVEIERVLNIVSVRAAYEIERKKIQKVIKTSEERYNQLLWSLSLPIVNLNKDGRLTFRNQRFLDLFGYDEKEVPTINEWWLKAYPDEVYRKLVIESWTQSVALALKDKTDVESNLYKVTCADGSVREIIISGSFVGEDFVAAFYDITDRKKAADLLRISEEKYKRLIENTLVGVFRTTLEGEIVYSNPAIATMLDYENSDQLISLNLEVLYLNKDQYKYMLDEIKAEERVDNLEVRMLTKLGKTRVFMMNAVYVDAFVEGTLVDITDRITAEENFKKLNEELESKVELRTLELVEQTKVAIQNEREALKQKEIADKERKIAEEQKEIAEQSRIVKEQFLATMSHEIRTPLNAIIGFQALLRDTPLNQIQKDYVESIDFAGKNLLVIVNDVLDLSKIEAGKLEFTEDEISIENLLKASLELIHLPASEKKLSVFFKHDKTIPEKVIGDAARFNQVILNLLSNALKFTEQGAISVSSKVLASNDESIVCEFMIQDTGIGIQLEKQKYVFDSFTQAEADTTRKYGGTGLGLTIVQRLLNLQNGKISLKSEVGKGSTFIFSLPFKKIKEHSKAAETTQIEVIAKGQEKKMKTIKILLAEDYLLNQQLVTAIMEKLGHELEIANNGQEAFDLHMKNEYDIILMDIQMPVLDGYSATKMIRELPDEKKKNIPIIAITANATQAETQKCLNSGMNACITKPFKMEHLNELILKLSSTAKVSEA